MVAGIVGGKRRLKLIDMQKKGKYDEGVKEASKPMAKKPKAVAKRK